MAGLQAREQGGRVALANPQQRQASAQDPASALRMAALEAANQQLQQQVASLMMTVQVRGVGGPGEGLGAARRSTLVHRGTANGGSESRFHL